MHLDRIAIVDFRPEHGPAFAALNRAWLIGHGILEPADELQLDDPVGQIITPGGRIFVAESDAAVLGTCALVPHGPGEFEIAKLAVAPAAQGQGLGRRLVDACIAHARARRAHRLVLLSSSLLTPALRLYESCGFAHRPMPSHNPYATADVYMELELDS